MKNLRKLAILVLDDPNGISEGAFDELQNVLVESGAVYSDIFDAVKCSEGRFYLPEDHNLIG